MHNKVLISAGELNTRIHNSDVCIIDCRFELKDPAWGFKDYQQSHIPGAVYADLDKDLASAKTPFSGRHPLPEISQFAQMISRFGIHKDDLVVIYDTQGGGMAARLWWLLRYYGYAHPVILDGSFNAWKNLNYPVETGINSRPAVPIPNLVPNNEMVVFKEEILSKLGSNDLLLVDARSPERFQGEQEPIDPIAGHIPGAVNRFHASNLDSSGFWKTPQQIRDEYNQIFKDTPPQNGVVYCGSGVTSCHNLVSMAIAEMPLPRLYVGSWSEWIKDPAYPIAIGE